ncbi:MAG: 50S ribosomal protein L17 [Anaerolineae bacterium]|nr:50S ribosomal protein L17 [Anaerolineae bacterium]
MRHRVAGRRLSRPVGHRRALYRNLITELFRHERIKTTEAKAKAVQAQAEKLITVAKRQDVHARRQVAAVLTDEAVVKRLVDEIALRYLERPGGYTRLVHLGPRLGDAAPMVLRALVE